jgi:hypothetical protein
MDKFIYTGLFLDNPTKKLLAKLISNKIDKNWKFYLDHMTMYLSGIKPEHKHMLNKKYKINIIGYAKDDRAFCFLVDPLNIPVENKIPHITIATNYPIGKPKHSNNIDEKNFIYFNNPISITGIIREN